ncbi:MAG: DUF6602 domain-containing protein [Leptolyngbyaceae cyanobacterium bins.59]|nr:DUF6602 domain-containing protein [Leptolyngbyaceae cyanobacterium bins.59]
MNDAQALIRDYFRTKSSQLSAASDLFINKHPGLIGSHREQIYRIYLQEIIPARFKVGRGIIHDGISHASKEADIVVWDALNYPVIPSSDHSFFFAESVKLVIECKSKFSKREFNDVLEKSKSIHELRLRKGMCAEEKVSTLSKQVDSLLEIFSNIRLLTQALDLNEANENRVDKIQLIIETLIKNNMVVGESFQSHRIATASIFLKGGRRALDEPQRLISQLISDKDKYFISDHWPDLILFLEPGIVVLKSWNNLASDSSHTLKFIKTFEDSLLLFTKHLLDRVDERIARVESKFYFDDYLDQNTQNIKPYFEQKFEVSGDYGASRIYWE